MKNKILYAISLAILFSACKKKEQPKCDITTDINVEAAKWIPYKAGEKHVFKNENSKLHNLNCTSYYSFSDSTFIKDSQNDDCPAGQKIVNNNLAVALQSDIPFDEYSFINFDIKTNKESVMIFFKSGASNHLMVDFKVNNDGSVHQDALSYVKHLPTFTAMNKTYPNAFIIDVKKSPFVSTINPIIDTLIYSRTEGILQISTSASGGQDYFKLTE